jgi:predicted regulator of amino acid metabolism with ACT domain
MWDKIANYFEKYPSQAKVARYLLKYGLRIERDQVFCGDVQIADSALARAAGVDRRVVKSTVETIKGVTEWLETVNTGDLATGPVGITDFLKKNNPSSLD